MEKIDVITIGILIYYVLDHYFIKELYKPIPVERDPYWQSIYGVVNENANSMKILANDSIMPSNDRLMEKEISTDTETKNIVNQLQKEFGIGGTEEDTIISEENYEQVLDINELDLVKSCNIDSCTSTNLVLNDNKKEYQIWYVIVVGKEGPFLHVYDGKRRWIHVGEFVKGVYINDDLLLTVKYTNKKLEVFDMIVNPLSLPV